MVPLVRSLGCKWLNSNFSGKKNLSPYWARMWEDLSLGVIKFGNSTFMSFGFSTFVFPPWFPDLLTVSSHPCHWPSYSIPWSYIFGFLYFGPILVCLSQTSLHLAGVVPKWYPSSFMTLKAYPPTLNRKILTWPPAVDRGEVSVISWEAGMHWGPTLLIEVWRKSLFTH